MENEHIQKVVFEYLQGFQELSSVKTKDVRIHVEKTLKLPDNYFSGDRKEFLLSTIASFHPSTASKPDKRNKASKEEGDYQKGRFNKNESRTILETMERYTEEQGITMDELCPRNRVKNGEGTKHYDLWKEMQGLLPHRSRNVCYCLYVFDCLCSYKLHFHLFVGNLASCSAIN